MRHKILAYSLKYDGNYDKIVRAIRRNETYEKPVYKGNYITLGEKDYPKSLMQLLKPPLILYYKGDISLLSRKCVSIVGSRRAKSYGIQETRKLVNSLSSDVVIVSGMALGIDSVAHNSAIGNSHKTIAVLGSGINYVYPKSNQHLYTKLCQHHLVISEYPDYTTPKPYFFPFRNRIIAALGECLYVMQASMKSGTMLSVNDALDLNKEVYVLPYRINDIDGEGCNYLIQQGANILMYENE